MSAKTIIVVCLVALGLGPFRIAEGQQPKKIPRIGFVTFSQVSAGGSTSILESFRRGLRDLGYVEGQTIIIDRRDAEGRLDRIPALVQDIVNQKVDVIVAPNNVAIRAAKELTKTIPIVMVSSLDPVIAGYVDSLSHPGGNITGLSFLARELSAKRLELLKELLPRLSRIAILWDADGPGPKVSFKEYEVAVKAFKLDFQSLEVRGPNPDFEEAFQAAKKQRADGLIIISNPLIGFHRKRIMDLATRNRLPSMNDDSRYVDAGGLVSYGTNYAELYRRVAIYVDKILKGAKPADLPVEQPTKFELVINLKAAKQIGLTIPQSLLYQADKVIK